MDRTSRARWPVGFVGMLALVATVEIALSRYPLRFSDTASLSWRLSVEALPREAARCEVACLGDSLVKLGVVPEVIRAGSGRPAYNFGMAQAPAPATYFLFRRLLEAGGRPAAIIVDFKPSIMAGGPRYGIHLWQAFLTPRECLEMARDSGSLGMMAEIVLGRALPSYRDRLEIREAVVSALHGKPAPTYATNRLAERNWGKNLGAHLNSSREPFSGEVTAEIHRKLLSDGWKCHKFNAMYVDRLLALAEARGIPVFWLVPPLSPPLQERREHSGADGAYVAFVRSMQAKHPGVTVIDGRHAGYDNGVFADHNHLNGRGAIAMSHELAAIVGRPRGQARWIELPRFRDRPLEVPAEDVDQSRLALEAEASGRF